jgi:hypothetical protein
MPQIIPDPADQTEDETFDPKLTREQIAERLPEISSRTKSELQAAGITFPIFFLIPTSGNALITVGTTNDPGDDEWELASSIAVSVMQEVLGTEHLKTNSIACALAHPVNNASEANGATV